MIGRKAKTPPLAYVAGGGFWLLYGAALPLYQPVHFLICGALSAGVFFFARALLKPRLRQLEFTSGASVGQVNETLLRGDAMVGERKALDGRIADSGVSGKIERIAARLQGMAEQSAKDSGKQKHVTVFLDHYLPATVSLLERYSSLEKHTVPSEDILDARREIAAALDTVVAAFDRQLEHMMRDDLMDISADVAALEGMLRQSGLADKRITK